MNEEWYESPAWDEAAQTDFRARLSRARDHKAHYLKMKIAAISEDHPQAALALCDERMSSDDDEDGTSAAYAKTCIYARLGEIDNMFASLRYAIGEDGLAPSAAAAGEFCCLAGYYGKSNLYSFALQILEQLDNLAMKELGRPFRSFAARAAYALIHYRSGRRDEAVVPARDALELALEQGSLFGGALKSGGPVPGFPSPIHDMLLFVAGLWDEKELGQPPVF